MNEIKQEINYLRSIYRLSSINKNTQLEIFEKIYTDRQGNKIKLLIDYKKILYYWYYKEKDSEIWIDLPIIFNNLMNKIFSYEEKEIEKINYDIEHNINNLLMIFQECSELDKNDITEIHDRMLSLKEKYINMNNKVIKILKVTENERSK